MMHTLYADDTYAKASKEDQAARIHLFGGFVVRREHEQLLIDSIRQVKMGYTHQNMPVKWNFKDPSVKKKYQEYKREAEYIKMLAASREWRLEIFRKIAGIPYTIVCSCIESFSDKKSVIDKTKDQLNSFCFENVLMRVGLDAAEIKGNWQCVLDWPPDNDSKPFDTGYYQLYHYAKGSSPNKSLCGTLESVGFSHSLLFTRCNHSPLMQLADLILGATRDHIECVIQGRSSSVGSEVVALCYDHYRNRDGRIPRYGVACSTGSRGLASQIAKAFERKANQSPQPTSPSRRGSA